ncbi:hypothetical protein [Croceimicrobium hydrocarbonivorans]|uniref:Uncharacterized protein n=1 Tax=Croceimicrobium hydrocarbonivorans TaxID=2761580 RepID=A0A7H0VDW4_9FLAO|nr:hypothetical protein [Croceimicrobium hydrocarbonivorans]QNR23912.1 hypothetical protein H4K34_16270 [Croceimicrobium hydrocarbonivorans]
MSWDIVLFNSEEKIVKIEELDESKLLPCDFSAILEASFNKVIKDDRHRSIEGEGYYIDYFAHDEAVSNMMLSLYGEKGLFELIKLARKHNWQIFDSSLGVMIDLEKPENNGDKRHRKYLWQILKQ